MWEGMSSRGRVMWEGMSAILEGQEGQQG